MPRVLILGGYGFTGRLLARHLLGQSKADVVLAGRRLEKAQACAESLNREFQGSRVSALRADASSEQDLRLALQGVDMVVVAAPTTQHAKTVIHATLDAGADYLDVQLDAGKLALLRRLAPTIEGAGRCFITEAGFHPGLPSAMVRYAASRLGRLDSAIVAGYLNMGRNLPYTEAVDELMETFRHYQAQVYKQGAWSRPNTYQQRKVNFGGAIGLRRCFSMFFEELRDLPRLIPTLQELGFYISETHWFVDWVITPLVFMGLKVMPKRGIRPLGKLMWWGLQRFSRGPSMVMLKLVAKGGSCGLEVEISHPDGYELTAIPVAACLLQYLDGTARRPGLWMMGHLVDPTRLVEDMERMGVTVSTAITRPD